MNNQFNNDVFISQQDPIEIPRPGYRDPLEALAKSCKLTLLFAILGISLAVVYPIYCFLTLVIAIVPLPVIGIIVSLFLSVIEIAIFSGSAFCCIFALVRSIIFFVKYSEVQKTPESKKLLTKNIVSLALSIGGLFILVISFFVVFVLGFIRGFLSAF